MLTARLDARVPDDFVDSLRSVLQPWFAHDAAPAAPADLLTQLVERSLGDLPTPGAGRTLARWRALSEVASHELSLAKLYEGHTDALAILHELGDAGRPELLANGSTWGVWAAEPPHARVVLHPIGDEGCDRSGSSPVSRSTARRVELRGHKVWCSGADTLSHALLTAWRPDGSGPCLVKVALRQPGVEVSAGAWAAVGMAASASLDVHFDGAIGEQLGAPGVYLSRPGFWQGALGIAACWHGGALMLARALHAAVTRAAAARPTSGATSTDAVKGAPTHPLATRSVAAVLGRVALGKVDAALQRNTALLHAAARWIDDHPHSDAGALALRTRLSVEDSVRTVIDEVGKVLGATPFCRDARFARMAADLPVYVRQSHADQDFAELGQRVAAVPTGASWAL